MAVADGGSTPKQRDGWMWDLTIPGNNDHDFYVLTVADADAAVLVHNCPTASSASGGYVRSPGRAPELDGGVLTQDQAMGAAEQWLGEGYAETSPGRYVSQDGMRVVRYGNHEVTSPVEHIHFEAYVNG
jgi:hypothetical protein